MGLDIVVAFFLLGVVSMLVKSDIDFPKGLYQTLTLCLLIAIGLKGGVALSANASLAILWQSLAVIVFGLVLPFVAFPILKWIGGWSHEQAATTAAHYGSVSVATFAVAISLLEAQGIQYEAYFPVFVAILEAPAIAVGLVLLSRGKGRVQVGKVVHEVAFNQGVFLLIGSMLIGWLSASSYHKVEPFFSTLFNGVLALFLLQMGRVASQKLPELLKQGVFLTTFAVFMPLLGGAAGGLLGLVLSLSLGGCILMATLGASASYIAVPAAFSAARPDINLSLPLTASLAVTFPFNVLVGIPLYSSVFIWLN